MSEADIYQSFLDKPLNRVGFDFDNTISKNLWPLRHAGPPIKKNIELIKDYYDKGFQIEIYTARPDWDRDYLEDWLIRHDVPYDRVVCGKEHYKEYYGDEARQA